jgi:pterin-4a-carbinolamine dehydratase
LTLSKKLKTYDWQIIDNQLTKTFNFSNFEEGLELLKKIDKIITK